MFPSLPRLSRGIHSRSEVIRRLGLLRRSRQRRDHFDEILVKGRPQIENLLSKHEDMRFKEILVSNRLSNYDFLENFRAHRIRKVDPELLYYISYQSKPLSTGKGLKSSGEDGELSDSDTAILSDPAIADSLMVGTLPKPAKELPADPRFVLCMDRVIFPDNVGSLIRSAHAIGGVDGIIGTPGTCDFNGWKVLEASRGYGFGIPKKVLPGPGALLDYIIEHKLVPLVGHSREGIDIRQVDLSKHNGVMVIIGNERHGPAREILDVAVRVKIPIEERMTSLNAAVAGGLLLQYAKGLLTKPLS